jgi:hypothetical protein
MGRPAWFGVAAGKRAALTAAAAKEAGAGKSLEVQSGRAKDPLSE